MDEFSGLLKLLLAQQKSPVLTVPQENVTYMLYADLMKSVSSHYSKFK